MELFKSQDFWSFIVAISTVGYLLVTIFMWLTTRKSVKLTEKLFHTSNRPIIGGSYFNIDFNDDKKWLTFYFIFKNYGKIPAKITKMNFDLIYNNEIQNVRKNKQPIATLFPENEARLKGVISTPEKYDLILDDKSVLEVVFEIEYSGIDQKTYRTEEKYEFKTIINNFFPTSSYWE